MRFPRSICRGSPTCWSCTGSWQIWRGRAERSGRKLRRVYLAQCAKVDAMFEAVCNALKEQGMYDDAAIFFLSDHGDFAGDYHMAEKSQNTFEDVLTRVPLLIKPPKRKDADGKELYPCDPGIAGGVVELVDFFATAMEYAGVEPTEDHFGRSLQPVIADRSVRIRAYAHCEGGRRPGRSSATSGTPSRRFPERMLTGRRRQRSSTMRRMLRERW